MIYYVTVKKIDGTSENVIYYPDDSELCIYDSVLTEKMGEYGKFEFTIPKQNKYYSQIDILKIICIYKDGTLVWQGYISEYEKDMYGCLKVICIEDLAIINMTAYRMKALEYKTTTLKRIAFEGAIDVLNAHFPALNFALGNIRNISRGTKGRYSLGYFQRRMVSEVLKSYMDDDEYLLVRRVNNINYIDLVAIENLGSSNQTIKFGENLLDYAESVNTNEFYNHLWVYAHYTYIQDDEPQNEFERFYVSMPDSIAKYGQFDSAIEIEGEDNYPSRRQIATDLLNVHGQITYTFNVTALDLSMFDADVDRMRIGDSVRIIAEPFDLDAYYRIAEVTTHLQEPEKNQYTLSANLLRNKTLTEYTKIGRFGN